MLRQKAEISNFFVFALLHCSPTTEWVCRFKKKKKRVDLHPHIKKKITQVKEKTFIPENPSFCIVVHIGGDKLLRDFFYGLPRVVYVQYVHMYLIN